MTLFPFENTTHKIYEKYYSFRKPSKSSHFKLEDGPNIRFGAGAKDINQLNWLSIEDLEQNYDLLDAQQASSLRSLVNPHLHKRNTQPLSITEGILSIAGQFHQYAQVCQCSTLAHLTGRNLNMKCDHRKYCDRCAGAKRRMHYKMFVDAWEKLMDKQVYLVTITATNNLVFDTSHTEYVTNIWDRMKMYVKELQKFKVIDGGMYTEELAVNSLYPSIQVNPHIHMVCTTKHELLNHEIDGMTVDVRLIDSKLHWKHALEYLTKAFDLSSKYAEEWTKKSAVKLNKNTRELANCFRLMLTRRSQSKCFGEFNRKSSTNIVISEDEYEKFHDKSTITDEKKPCIKQSGEIEYIEMSLAPSQIIPPPTKKEEPSMLKKVLGYGGLAAAGLGGAYLYGRMGVNGSNFLTPFADSLDKNVINPAYLRAEPYLQKILPSGFSDRINQSYNNQINDYVGSKGFFGQFKDVKNPSQLHGTPYENYALDDIEKASNRFTNNPLFGSALNGHLALTAGAEVAPTAGKLLSKLPMFSRALSAGEAVLPTVGRSLPIIGNGLGIAAGVGDSMQLGDAAAEKYGLGNFGRNAAKAGTLGLHTAGVLGGSTLGAVGGGALAGAISGGTSGSVVPGIGNVVGAVGGGLIGSMAVPMANMYRQYANNGELLSNSVAAKKQAIVDLLQKGVDNQTNYGNSNLLNALKKILTPEQVSDLSKTNSSQLLQYLK